MNINIDEDFEEQINNEFKEQIEDLPEEFQEPVENTLNYIKKRAHCNDYEAAQIQLLMSVHSGQKKGFEYYARYIAGQSTPEEDKADYYISIRKSWDRFLDKYANMTEEERVNALITSSSFDKVVEVLSNASPKQLEYIFEKTEEEKNKLEKLSTELTSHKKSYLITHPKYTMNKVEEFNSALENYNRKVITSAKTYELKETPTPQYVDKLNAYNNGIEARDSLRTNGKDVKIQGGGFNQEEIKTKAALKDAIWKNIKSIIDESGNPTGEGGTMMQIQLGSNRSNMPMYLYALVYKKIGKKRVYPDGFQRDTRAFDCSVMTLEPLDKNGEIINVNEQCKKKIKVTDDDTIPTEIDFLSLVGYDARFEDETKRRLITLDEIVAGVAEDLTGTLSKVKIKYYIELEKEAVIANDNSKIVFSDLYRIYQKDPTYLKHRISSLPPTVEKSVEQLAIGTATIGSVLATIGILLTIMWFAIGIAAIVNYCRNRNKKNKNYINLATEETSKDNQKEPDRLDRIYGAWDNVQWNSRIGLAITTLTIITTGATTIPTSAISIHNAHKRKEDRAKELLKIYQDIKKHNEFPKISEGYK